MIKEKLKRGSIFYKLYLYFNIFIRYKILKSHLKTYSQFGEDLFIDDFFQNQKEGKYVDLGAFHPMRLSNTFLLHKKGRKKKLDFLLNIKSTVILYESPHRLLKLLYELKVADQDNRDICVLRELTKLHEEIRKGKVEELIKYFENKSIKGEIVLVINKVSKKNNNE